MKFKVGDRVEVVRCRTHKNCKHINTIGKIIDIVASRCFPYEIENCDEIFRDDELELVQEKQFTKADLKKGDKCTLKNRAVVFFGHEYNYRFNNLDEQLRYICNDNASIVKVERPVKYETVFERKEEILDETEKKYLESVIRPFKKRVKSIIKKANFCSEYISINIKNDGPVNFPYLKEDTMYRGMETDRNYTLEELEL